MVNLQTQNNAMRISEAAQEAVKLDPNRIWTASKNQHIHSENGEAKIQPIYCKITVHPGIKNQTSVESFRAPTFEECLTLIKDAQFVSFMERQKKHDLQAL